MSPSPVEMNLTTQFLSPVDSVRDPGIRQDDFTAETSVEKNGPAAADYSDADFFIFDDIDMFGGNLNSDLGEFQFPTDLHISNGQL